MLRSILSEGDVESARKLVRDQHCRQEGCSGGEVFEEDGFVAGVGAFADGTHAVERGNAEG